MKRKNILVVILSLMAILLFPSISVQAENISYTYTYDYVGENRESPDAYSAQYMITGGKLGIDDFKDPQGIYVRGNRIYISDTGNNRIVILEKINNEIHVIDEFNSFTGDSLITTFSGPQDVFVTENGDIYICDTNNQRVIHINSNYELLHEIGRPEDETVDKTSDFLPVKLVVDSSGRVIVLAKNYNKGVVTYSYDGEFIGYMGASEVKFNMIDYMWKMVSTKEQRAQMEQFVPTEYNNIALDKDGFIYATNSVFDEYELKTDKAKPIRKLNSQGTDILIKNGWYPPIGDIIWGNAAGISGPSKLIDVTVLDNDTYYALDRTRGKIFAYDFQGNLLYAFGGIGNKLGYFQYPTGIENIDNDLLVLDSSTAGITVFTHTYYGDLIENALTEYKNGDYDLSQEYWQKVLMHNGNYDLAYIGIGRNLLRQEKYKDAMNYFELKYDDDNYSKAFELYRQEWIEDNIVWIFTIFFVVIFTPTIVGIVKKMKKEVEEA